LTKSSSSSSSSSSSTKAKPKTPPKKSEKQLDQSKSSKHNDNQKQQTRGHKETTDEVTSLMNVTVVKNPDAEQLKQIKSNSNTKYVIVKTGGGGTIQKLSTVGSGDVDQVLNEITIKGKNYKIDSEFKLNELVKENENALSANGSHKDLLTQLPNILKHTINQRNGGPTTFKIVNVVHNNSNRAAAGAGNVTKIVPKPSYRTQVTSSSISLQVQEQIRTSLANNKNFVPRLSRTNTSTAVCLPTDGPVKPIQLVQAPKVNLPSFAAKKRAIYTSPLNTPMPTNTPQEDKSRVKKEN